MKGISVNYNNLLVKFLMKRDNHRYFWTLPLWPDPLLHRELPKDTCSLFWSLVGHSLILIKNFLWIFTFAFCVGFIAYSVITSVVLYVYFGINPFSINEVVPSVGSTVILAALMFGIFLGGMFAIHKVRGKLSDMSEKKPPIHMPSKVYEGAKLIRTLFKAFHEKTCFKIEYVKGDSNGRD